MLYLGMLPTLLVATRQKPRRVLFVVGILCVLGLGTLTLTYHYFFTTIPLRLTGYSLQLGCALYDTRLEKRRSYPGWTCLFVPDTDLVISSDEKSTYALRRSGQLVWQQPIGLHHQISLAHDGKSVLSLGHELRTEGKARVRYDTAVQLDLLGRVMKEFRFSQHAEKLFSLHPSHPKRTTPPPLEWGAPLRSSPKYDVEEAHANSIYEIGPNALEATQPAFRRGNYIVNFYRPPITVILDGNMKEILWTFSDIENVGPQISASGFHDVQVLANGNLLVYLNYDYTCNHGRSSLREINPLTRAREWTFCPTSQPILIGGAMGGVQLLGNGLVLTSQSNQVSSSKVQSHVVVGDSSTQEIIFRAETTEMEPAVQQARLIHNTTHRPVPAGMIRSAIRARKWRSRLEKAYSQVRKVTANF